MPFTEFGSSFQVLLMNENRPTFDRFVARVLPSLFFCFFFLAGFDDETYGGRRFGGRSAGRRTAADTSARLQRLTKSIKIYFHCLLWFKYELTFRLTLLNLTSGKLT